MAASITISNVCWPIFRFNRDCRASSQRRLPAPENALPGPWRNSRRLRCNTFGFTSNARDFGNRGSRRQPAYRGYLDEPRARGIGGARHARCANGKYKKNSDD